MQHRKQMDCLMVLHLPKATPSITYRAWARGDRGFSTLGWYVRRLIQKHGSNSLLIACHDETDRAQAEDITSGCGVYAAVCAGASLLEGLGELAPAFPGLPIAYFQVEAVFAPSDLLDRVLAHHHEHKNDFTFVPDLPPQLTPEVVDSTLIATLARVDYGAAIPAVRDAVARLARVRPELRSEPFRAAAFYRLPKLSRFSPMVNRDDATRARQVLSGLPEEYAFEAVERWPTTTFEPVFGFTIQAPQRDRTRILYVSPSSFYAGGEECLRGLAQELGRMGFQQTAVVGADGLLAARLRDAGCDVITANWQFAVRMGPGVNKRFAEEVLDSVKPHVLYCNDEPGDAFRHAARRHGIGVITHVRAVTSQEGVPFESFGDADHYITVSKFAKRRLIEAGVCSERISVVYDGVDTDYFSPDVFDAQAMRRDFDLPQDSLVVLMIARPVAQKRHELMMEAFCRLQQNGARSRLVFVGDHGNHTYLEAMQQKATCLHLGESVVWVPFQDDIRRIHCSSDLVALPSDGEALGTSVLEAMSLGKPVVVSNSGGTHELLQHEINGLVVPGGDVHALATALQSLADSPCMRARLGDCARRTVLERFTLQSHAEQIAAVIRYNTQPY